VAVLEQITPQLFVPLLEWYKVIAEQAQKKITLAAQPAPRGAHGMAMVGDKFLAATVRWAAAALA
jgi:hypothetical protein